MAFADITYTGDGSTLVFNIPFSYINESHLVFYVAGVSTAAGGSLYTATVLTGGTTVQIKKTSDNSAVASGTAIKIERNTPITTPSVVFSNSSTLKAADLNTEIDQLLYSAQETADDAAGKINLDATSHWDADSKKIRAVADPVDAQDAVTKNYLESTFLTPSDKTNLTAVAGKTTEIGLLGTTDAVADMAIIGTADFVSDMNTVASADFVSDLNTVSSADFVADLNVLATADVVADMNTLGTSANVTAMDTVAASITNVNTNATSIASINTNAANISSITGASTQASDAATSASAASTSETNAAASALAAAGSAAAAAVWCDTATGTSDALVLTPAAAITSYTTGRIYNFKASAASNTGAATVAISGLAATALEINDVALSAGDIESNKYYSAFYDGTAFQIEQISAATLVTETDTDTSNTGSVTIDFSAHQNFVLTLTGNVTLANPSTEAVGQSGVFVFIQDGTGSRTLSLGTDYESPASGGITLSTAAAAVDVVPYFVKASGSIQLGAPQLAFG